MPGEISNLPALVLRGKRLRKLFRCDKAELFQKGSEPDFFSPRLFDHPLHRHRSEQSTLYEYFAEHLAARTAITILNVQRHYLSPASATLPKFNVVRFDFSLLSPSFLLRRG
jgi:hypothetical protein